MSAVAREVRLRVAVCLVRDERLLLVEHEKAGRRYWLLPGGGVESCETLIEAARREVVEETGYGVEVGRLVLLCEAIEPGGRHIVNFFFAGEIAGGSLRLGDDGRLRDARWIARDAIGGIRFMPPVRDELTACWDEDFRGAVRVLGNVWRSVD